LTPRNEQGFTREIIVNLLISNDFKIAARGGP